MRSLLVFFSLLFISSCSFKPSTKNDIYKEKASLPQDERVHYKNSTEWWYITGHLKDVASGKTYGVEYVFFHFNPLSAGDHLMGNFAISNPEDSMFYHDYVYQKQKQLLDTLGPLNLSIQHKDRDWSFKGENGQYELKAAMQNHEGYAIDLTTTPTKEVAMYRGIGYEQYTPEKRAGYYSFPRLETHGKIQVDGEWKEVEGELWYDRQWNCGGVLETKVGWDWMSIQLENGEDLMLYRIFRKNKESKVCSGALIDAEGNITHYDGMDEIQIVPLENWKSPQSKKMYPVKWKVTIPKKGYELTVNAIFPNQELRLSFFKAYKFHYWEGMCSVEGTINGEEIEGNAYLEMTNH